MAVLLKQIASRLGWVMLILVLGLFGLLCISGIVIFGILAWNEWS